MFWYCNWNSYGGGNRWNSTIHLFMANSSKHLINRAKCNYWKLSLYSYGCKWLFNYTKYYGNRTNSNCFNIYSNFSKL